MILLSNKTTKFIKFIFTTLLLVLSICWIVYIFMQEREGIITFFENITTKSVMYLSFSIIFGATGVFQHFIIFREIIYRHMGQQLSVKNLSTLFFRGQIVRYLPGRFFGILYQTIKAKNKIPASIIMKSNVELMVFMVLFNFFTSIFLITICKSHYLFSFFGFLTLMSGIYIYLSLDLFYNFSKVLSSILPGKWEKIKILIPINRKYSRKSVLKIVLAYLISWVFYLFSWMLFVNIFQDLTIESSILMCATYTFSWVIGFISMLTPGGLGIREGVFIYSSSLFNISNNIAFLAVFLRIWLIVIDFLLVFVSIIMNLDRKSCSNSA